MNQRDPIPTFVAYALMLCIVAFAIVALIAFARWVL